MSVTITSVHSEVLGKHVPVVMSVSFRRTADHYQPHFEVLLKNLKCKTYDDFLKTFPGNLCDFSKMERNGFRQAVFKIFGTTPTEPTESCEASSPDDLEALCVPNLLTKQEDLDLPRVWDVSSAWYSECRTSAF